MRDRASVAVRTAKRVAQNGQFADHVADAAARGGGKRLVFQNGEEKEHVAARPVAEQVELVRRGAQRR